MPAPPHPLYEEAPDAALGRPALARILPWLYLTGVAFCLVSVFLSPGRPAAPAGLIATAAVAAACGLALVVAGRRLPVAAVPGMLACGTLLISAAIHFDGRTPARAELVYAWVAIAMAVGLGLLVYSVKDEVDSLGVATFPAHGTTVAALVSAADQALHAAKEFGRNRTVVYSAEIAAVSVAEDTRRESGDEMQLATLLSLAEALDIRDTGTARHARTVGRLSELMAEELGLTEPDMARVRLAGVLHDIGKIGIPDRVLNKPGPLTDEEWAEMRTHPEIGARLLARPEFEDLRAWVLAHHERPDGRGYPFGLSAGEIPLEAAIVAVADAFEAMTADRVYRPAMALEAAVAELEAGAGSQFDAQVVETFGRVVAQPAWNFSIEASIDSAFAAEAPKGS